MYTYVNVVHSYIRTCGRSWLSDYSLQRADQKSFLESYVTVITMKFYEGGGGGGEKIQQKKLRLRRRRPLLVFTLYFPSPLKME